MAKPNDDLTRHPQLRGTENNFFLKGVRKDFQSVLNETQWHLQNAGIHIQ